MTPCGNTDHHEATGDGSIPPARWTVAWPDGRFNTTTACDHCLSEVILPELREDCLAVALTPLDDPA